MTNASHPLPDDNTPSNLDTPQADMRWLWGYVRQHRGAAFGALGCGMIGGITGALEPYLIGVIIDNISRGVEMRQILNDIALLIILSIVTVAAFWGQRRYSGDVAYNVLFDIRRNLFDHLLTLENGFYQRYAVGDLISRMHSDLDMIWRLLAIGFNRFGSAFVTVIATFILLGLINLPLTLLTFAVLAISTAFQIRAGLYLHAAFERVQTQGGNLSALVQDAFSGIQTIKTFGQERGAADKFHEQNREYRRQWLYFKRRNEPVGMLPNMISQSMTGVVVLFGGIMAVNGSITLGNFTQFLVYLSMISLVLLQLGTIYQRYQQTRGALTRITPLLAPPTITDAPDARPLPSPQGDIRLEEVTVRLGGATLLDRVSVHIPAGAVVGIVGATGSGKTLLVSLLARVLDPDSGRVLIDGQDVRCLNLTDLRRAIAYVPQATFLFSQTLGENVRMGRIDLNDDDLSEAIHISRLSNDLPQLPAGLETMVGEKGVMLSGGQKQRVAIARAILRDPAILILDDALSSVDTRTAADILSGLRGVVRQRTSLIIAHRIASVKDADFIICMEDGRIIEQGSHADLIARDGFYARMVKRELQEEENLLYDEV